MQLKYNKVVKKNIIIIELETTNFTPQENDMLDEFDEPVVSFSKIYNNKFTVQFEKKIRTGFKIKVKFDGTDDIALAATAANSFFDDIQDELGKLMSALADKAYDADFMPDQGTTSIPY